MSPQVQFAVGIAVSVVMFATGATFLGRADEAVRAIAVLGLVALGLMLLADLLLIPGVTLRTDNSLSTASLQVIAFQIGAISLGLLALALMLMASFTGVVWSVRQGNFADLVVLGVAILAQLGGAILTAVSLFGLVQLDPVTQRTILPLAGFALGTLAAALIAFWAVPVVRRNTRSRRVTASGPPM